MTQRVLWLGLFLGIFFISCKQVKEEQPTASYRVFLDTVYVENKELLAEKVKLALVSEELVTREVITAATIQAIPTQYAYIAPPFSGRVVRSYIQIGEKVQRNTPLFEIISSDFTAAQKEFFQAESDRELARINLERQKDLKANGVGSQKELDEAKNALFLADKEYENAYTALQIFQTNPSQMKLGQPLVVRAPIAGEVIDNFLVTGQYLSSESEHVAIVADLSKVWVVAQVKEKDIRYIHEGDKMDIHISAHPDYPLEGKVYHIEESIDLETRSIKVLSVCDNKEGLLKLGMYATVHFTDQPKPALVVPEKAILQGEDSSYLFVKNRENVYVKTPVDVDVTREGRAVVRGNLKANDVVVSEGGYYFK